MTRRGCIAAMATVVLLAYAFVLMADRVPGLYVLVLTCATFGLGAFYGVPTRSLVDHEWRRMTRTRRLAVVVGARRLSRALDHLGWNRALGRQLRSRADLEPLRGASTESLLSHGTSAILHLVAATALAVLAQPWWALAAAGAGLLVHVWPALLQVDLLGRVDELQARAQAPRPSSEG